MPNNAFNSLNRQVALLNIQHLCPVLSIISTNCLRRRAELFVDGSVLYSEEGATQGNPLAMPVYSLAMIPLIKRLREKVNVGQVWHADDASAIGKLRNFCSWWNQLVQTIGLDFGLHVNNVKTWLVVKPSYLTVAKDFFGNTAVKITFEGHPYLGGPLGPEDYVENFVHSKVNQWNRILPALSEIAMC